MSGWVAARVIGESATRQVLLDGAPGMLYSAGGFEYPTAHAAAAAGAAASGGAAGARSAGATLSAAAAARGFPGGGGFVPLGDGVTMPVGATSGGHPSVTAPGSGLPIGMTSLRLELR